MNTLKLFTLTIIFLVLSSCAASDNFGDDAEANKTQTLEIEAEISEAYAAALQVAGQQRWNVTASDSEARFFSAEYDSSMRQWGDKVSVSLSSNNGIVTITVNSSLGQRPNREVVAQYLETLRERLNQSSN